MGQSVIYLKPALSEARRRAPLISVGLVLLHGQRASRAPGGRRTPHKKVVRLKLSPKRRGPARHTASANKPMRRTARTPSPGPGCYLRGPPGRDAYLLRSVVQACAAILCQLGEADGAARRWCAPRGIGPKAMPVRHARASPRTWAHDGRSHIHSLPRSRSPAPSDSSSAKCGAPLSACCRQSPGVIPIRSVNTRRNADTD